MDYIHPTLSAPMDYADDSEMDYLLADAAASVLITQAALARLMEETIATEHAEQYEQLKSMKNQIETFARYISDMSGIHTREIAAQTAYAVIDAREHAKYQRQEAPSGKPSNL